MSNGYYNVPVVVMEKTDNGWLWIGSEDIRVWISQSTSTDDDDDDTQKTYDLF